MLPQAVTVCDQAVTVCDQAVTVCDQAVTVRDQAVTRVLRLSPRASQPATVRIPACNRTHPSLQPYVSQAVDLVEKLMYFNPEKRPDVEQAPSK